MKKSEIKEKSTADFVDYDKKIMINCFKCRSENLRIHNDFSMCNVIQTMNEASIFYKQMVCLGVEETNFDNVVWTEANPDFVL